MPVAGNIVSKPKQFQKRLIDPTSMHLTHRQQVGSTKKALKDHISKLQSLKTQGLHQITQKPNQCLDGASIDIMHTTSNSIDMLRKE